MTPDISAGSGRTIGEALAQEGRRVVRREAIRLYVARIALVAVLLIAWQLASGTLLHPFFLSSPSAVFARLAQWTMNGALFFHLGVTALEMIVGFVGGVTLGLMLGIVLGACPLAERILSPFLIGLNALPKIALAPILVILFGVGVTSKIALVISVVLFLVMFNIVAGMQQADSELLRALRLMGAGRMQTLRYVIVPGAIAYVFVGMKLSLRYALNYAVVGEILAGNSGIGSLMSRSLGDLDTSGVMAGVVVLVLCGLALYTAMSHLESKVLAWRTP